jgi:hypothetical protein
MHVGKKKKKRAGFLSARESRIWIKNSLHRFIIHKDTCALGLHYITTRVGFLDTVVLTKFKYIFFNMIM